MKKLGAILLFLLAGILIISQLAQIPKLLGAILALFSGSLTAYTSGMAIGTILAFILFVWLGILCIKSGRKILRKEKESEDTTF